MHSGMNTFRTMLSNRRPSPCALVSFSSSPRTKLRGTRYFQSHASIRSAARQKDQPEKDAFAIPTKQSIFKPSFWSCHQTWKRTRINTLRCLLGCTAGDFSTLWMLQTYSPDLGMGPTMAMSMSAGISTSIILETLLLRLGKDNLPWGIAARTAAGMSLVSMLAMEIVENAVDIHLTGAVVAVAEPRFWMAAVVSIGAGYLAPLSFNYWRLRRFGKGCH